MSDSLKIMSDSLIRSFMVSDLSESLIKKEGMTESLFFLRTKNVPKNTILDFLSKIFERIPHSLIYHERPKGITHGGSFVMSDLSDSLTVAHLS